MNSAQPEVISQLIQGAVQYFCLLAHQVKTCSEVLKSNTGEYVGSPYREVREIVQFVSAFINEYSNHENLSSPGS